MRPTRTHAGRTTVISRLASNSTARPSVSTKWIVSVSLFLVTPAVTGSWSKGQNATVYLNGSSDGSESIGSTSIGDNGSLYIGGNENDNHQLNGLLDDLRIYDKELTSSEVSNWYNTGNIQ